MIPWELLDTAPIPGNGGQLQLLRRGREFSIQIAGGGVLMSSRVHDSEEALAQEACSRVADRPRPRVLIGGLGMGFTLAAALRHLGPGAEVLVAELVPAVVAWNRGILGALAGHPLGDPRAAVREGDVAATLTAERSAYDVILLDVDNGPEGLTSRDNGWLYGREGLMAAHAALRPAGILAVWSAGPDRRFTDHLRQAGFRVHQSRVRAHAGKGERHNLWLAERGPRSAGSRPGTKVPGSH